MKSTKYLRLAAEKMRDSAEEVEDNGSGWTKETILAVANWLEEESNVELELGPEKNRKLYDMPGMSNAPAVMMAKSFLGVNE